MVSQEICLSNQNLFIEKAVLKSMMKKKRKPDQKNQPILLFSAVAVIVVFGFLIFYFNHPRDQLKESPDIFFSVVGHVNGNPVPNATIFVYALSDTRLETVLATIKNTEPFLNTTMNETNGYRISYISPGDYAAVMPDTSFDGPIGGPVPKEWRHNNYELKVIHHGYDHQSLVVAFSIKNLLET
jgi:hypothetical protein